MRTSATVYKELMANMELGIVFSGIDGSRAIKSVSLDTTGKGESFKTLSSSAITKNGVTVCPLLIPLFIPLTIRVG